MKTTVKVSLAGFAYILEEDAYTLLNTYLNSLKTKFANDKEGADIIKDIEERISELISEKKAEAEAVSIEIIKDILHTLGEPEDIASDAPKEGFAQDGERRYKRLYRETEHSYIAGVCSGLSEYFAVDPVVFRIIFLALIFAKGFGLLLYLVLWIAVPRAITPRQKLEMKGEPVNLSNIEKTVKDEYKEVNETLKRRGFSGFLQKFFGVVGQIAYAILRALLIFIKVIAIFIGAVLILTMLILLITLLGVIFFGSYFAHSLIPTVNGFSFSDIISSMFDISSSIWITLPLFLVIAIPIITLLYIGIRIIFRFKARDALLGIIASIIWAASIITLAFIAFYQAKSFTIRQHVTETVTLMPDLKVSKVLYIKATEKPDSLYDDPAELVDIDDYSFGWSNGKALIYGEPDLSIEKSDTEYPVLEFKKSARGASQFSARENAERIVYTYQLKDSLLNFNSYFTLPLGEKWKVQELDITLKLPVGYTVYFDESLGRILNFHQPYSDFWPDELVNKRWVMTEKSLKPAN